MDAGSGESFRAGKPQPWSETRFVKRQRTGPTRSYDLHPDGERIALGAASAAQIETRQDKVVCIFNFFDELRRLASTTKR